jgi:biopolymer transport protein ExbB/TolQ
MNKWQMVNMFFHGGAENRSTIPYYTMLLSFWCIAFLLLKWRKLKVQKMALSVQLIPDTADYIISPMNAKDILAKMGTKINRVEDFLVLWRVQRALANIKNIGNVSDVSSLLTDLAESDSDFVENSYTLPKGLIWAIPVLGFIGTVLGLSQAVGGFGAVISQGADLEALQTALGGVTGGLATAFETTLIALVAALIIQLLMTLVMQQEEGFLNACSDYCYKNLTSHLKMINVDEE